MCSTAKTTHAAKHRGEWERVSWVAPYVESRVRRVAPPGVLRIHSHAFCEVVKCYSCRVYR